MLLKTLLNNVVKYIDNHPEQSAVLFFKLLCLEQGREVKQTVLSLDLDSVADLRKLLPGAFPRKLRHKPLVVHQNSIGAWRVDVCETSQPIS